MVGPYSEVGNLRTFSEKVAEEELKWHFDEEDREIQSLDKTDWLLQLDNELPQEINETIFIKAGTYHRLIKGSGDLILQITRL